MLGPEEIVDAPIVVPERPLVMYRKREDCVLALLKGLDPIEMAPGDTLTVTYRVTNGLRMHTQSVAVRRP